MFFIDLKCMLSLSLNFINYEKIFILIEIEKLEKCIKKVYKGFFIKVR